jgi:hypothetical protein
MFALLNWRVLLLAALVCALSFTHFSAYRAGKANVRAEWSASVAAANVEAFKKSERLQRNVDVAATAATARQTRIRADSARAGDAVIGLRNAIAAKRAADDSAAAANKRADTLGILLVESGEALREMALSCDRIVSDRQMLLDAWPK